MSQLLNKKYALFIMLSDDLHHTKKVDDNNNNKAIKNFVTEMKKYYKYWPLM